MRGAAATRKKKTTTILRKRTGITMRRVTVYLPEDFARDMRKRCVDEDRNISDVMTGLATKWMQPLNKPADAKLRKALDVAMRHIHAPHVGEVGDCPHHVCKLCLDALAVD